MARLNSTFCYKFKLATLSIPKLDSKILGNLSMSFYKTLLLLGALGLSAGSSAADYSELVNGDLSSNNLAPTNITVSAGSNIVSGSTVRSPQLDRDFFTITIGANQLLDSITLVSYSGPSNGSGSFMAIQQGPEISSLNSADLLLGTSLIGKGLSGVGSDILDDLGNASFGGAGFVGALGNGTYTFWYQELAGPTTYTFDFHITTQAVPEPENFAMLLAGIGAIAAYLRRRKSV